MEKEKVNFEEVKCIKTITVHDFPINALLLLKDKRVASCSADKHYENLIHLMIITVIK